MTLNRRHFLGGLGAVAAGSLAGARTTHAQGVRQLSALIQKGGMGPGAEVAIKKYEEVSGVKVAMTPVPWEAQFEKTMVEFVGRSTTFDVIPMFTSWRGAMSRFMTDLNPMVAKAKLDAAAFPKGVWDSSKWKGQQYGLPFRLGLEGLFYYRKDLYDKHKLQVPKTMEELLRNAEILTSAKDNVYGYGTQLGGDPNSFLQVQAWHLPYGGRLLRDPDQDEVAPFDGHGELMIKVLGAWKTMLDKKWMPQSVVTWGILDVLTAFQQGLIAQATMFSPRVLLVEDPKNSKVAGRAGYELLFGDPGKAAIGPRAIKGDIWHFGVNQWISDARKEAAFKVVEYMAGRDAQLAAALNAANGPVRTDVLSDRAFHKPYPAWRPLREGLPFFHTGVSVAEQPKLSRVVSDRIAEVLLGREKPDAGARTMWKEMEAVVKESRRS